jgi:hypothetical protein
MLTYTVGVENNIRCETRFGERQVLHGINTRADTLLAVTTRELVAYDRVSLEGHHYGNFIQWLLTIVASQRSHRFNIGFL